MFTIAILISLAVLLFGIFGMADEVIKSSMSLSTKTVMLIFVTVFLIVICDCAVKLITHAALVN